MQFSILTSAILAFVVAVQGVAIATLIDSTEVSESVGLVKRDGTAYMDVYGSGGSRSASASWNGHNTLSASVSCGTVTVTNMDGYEGLCTAQLAGGFSGCEGCEYFGNLGRFSLRVSMKCGNAHIRVGVNMSGGGGEIGENINVHDCNGKAGGGAKTMNICAGSNWTLFRC